MTATAFTAEAVEVDLADLGRTHVLARGGVGTVEAIAADAVAAGRPLVLKRYHRPGDVDAGVLAELVRWRRELSDAERRRLDRTAAWPLAVVVRADGVAVGFVMNRVPEAFTDSVRLPSGGRRDVLREAQYLVASARHTQRLGLPAPSAAVRLQIVWSLAEALAFMHERRIVLGDLSTRNVLWDPSAGRVHLVDCDSAILPGVGSPLPTATTVDWDDPAQPHAAASSDVYKLALLVLRVLARSFQTRDPAGADPYLDPTGRWLLRASLSNKPDERPSAGAWERWAAGRRAARS